MSKKKLYFEKRKRFLVNYLLIIFERLSGTVFADMIETVGDHRPSYAIIKNWVAACDRGQMSKMNTVLEDKFL